MGGQHRTGEAGIGTAARVALDESGPLQGVGVEAGDDGADLTGLIEGGRVGAGDEAFGEAVDGGPAAAVADHDGGCGGLEMPVGADGHRAPPPRSCDACDA